MDNFYRAIVLFIFFLFPDNVFCVIRKFVNSQIYFYFILFPSQLLSNGVHLRKFSLLPAFLSLMGAISTTFQNSSNYSGLKQYHYHYSGQTPSMVNCDLPEENKTILTCIASSSVDSGLTSVAIWENTRSDITTIVKF